MTKYEEIKQSRLEARKAGREDDKQARKGIFLSTVMGDIQRRAEKEGCKDSPTDAVVVAEIKAYLKRYDEESQKRGLTQEQVDETVWIETYLPKAATRFEILAVIEEVRPETMKDMGKAMGAIKQSFENVDMGLAGKLVKGYINDRGQ